MNETVILAEKPSQALAYASVFKHTKYDGYYHVYPCSVFPNGATITYGIGHLVELKEPHEYDEKYKNWKLEDLPIIPKEFQFKVSDDKKKQFKIVKDLLEQAREIIIATDSDREGENIARSIISLANVSNKPIKRLWINSLEKDEVLRGFQNLKNGNEYIPMYHEAQARQIGDWLVGLNASRLYTLLLKKKGISDVFSVGRVQTPTLYLIYQRQKEIENFKSVPFFELEGKFYADKGTYIGKNDKRFNSKQEIEEFIKRNNISLNSELAYVKNVDIRQKRKRPPLLHSLSSLQTLANKKYKYSPKKVLEIVQSLYDSPLKLVTYPRTDTQYITTNEFEYLKTHLKDYQNILSVDFEPKLVEPDKRFVDNTKVQEHYAIIPTKIIPTENVMQSLSEEQRHIYLEIVKSVVAMFHDDFIYEETEVITEVKGIIFKTKGNKILLYGWKELFNDENDKDDKTPILPPVQEGMKVQSQLMIKEGKTTPPKPYTEGQLINLMKYCGKFVQDISEEELAVLKEVEGLGTEATRSGIIETLKKQKYIEVKKNIVHVTLKGEILCKAVEGTLLAKPDMTAIWESYLKKIGQRKGTKDNFIKNIIDFTSKLVQTVTVETINLEDKQIAELKQVDSICQCPTCKTGFIVDKHTFYGCSNFKNGCKQTFPKKLLGKSISKSTIKTLCTKGKTGKIKGFKGKKPFDAFLVLKNGEIKFEFN